MSDTGVMSQQAIDDLIAQIGGGAEAKAPAQPATTKKGSAVLPCITNLQENAEKYAKWGDQVLCKIVIGQCSCCKAVADLSVNLRGQVAKMPVHYHDGIKCPGSEKKAIPLTMSTRGGFDAATYAKNIRTWAWVLQKLEKEKAAKAAWRARLAEKLARKTNDQAA